MTPPPSQQLSPMVIGLPASRPVARWAGPRGGGVSSCTLGPISVLRPIRIGARSRKTQSKLTKEPSPMEML